MAADLLRENTRKCIKYLLSVPNISVRALQQYMDVSARTLFYLREEVNRILVSAGLPPIRVHQGGLELLPTQRTFLRDLMSRLSFRDVILSSFERQSIILLRLLLCPSMYPAEMTELLGISRSTFYDDMGAVKQTLSLVGCRLRQSHAHAYELIGSEESRRLLLVRSAKDISRSFPLLRIDFLAEPALMGTHYKLCALYKAEHPDASLPPDKLALLAVLLCSHLAYSPQFAMPLRESPHMRAVRAAFPTYTEGEHALIAAVLFGADEHSEARNPAMQMCRRIVAAFEAQGGLAFKDAPHLAHQIYTHLLINGYLALSYDYQLQRKTLEDIRNQYNELYLQIVACLKPLQTEYPILAEEFIRLGILLKIGAALKELDLEREGAVFIYTDKRALFVQIEEYVHAFDARLRVIDMADFSYRPEEERMGRLLISTVEMSRDYNEMPVLYVREGFNLEEKIKLMLLLASRESHAFDVPTGLRIFNFLKEDMSLAQLQYAITQVTRRQ